MSRTPATRFEPPNTRLKPPLPVLNHQTRVSSPQHTSQPLVTRFEPPNTHLEPPPTCFEPPLTPQALKHTYEQSYVCFFFFYLFFGIGNACTIARTRVSCLIFIIQLRKRVYEQSYTRFFIHFYYLTAETRVRAIVHAFLMFFFIYYVFYPQNVCTNRYKIHIYIYICPGKNE